MMTKEYKDFTVNTYKYVTKKPFVAWYYADANLAIAREIKHTQKLYATVAASGINLMKASMDEKMNRQGGVCGHGCDRPRAAAG